MRYILRFHDNTDRNSISYLEQDYSKGDITCKQSYHITKVKNEAHIFHDKELAHIVIENRKKALVFFVEPYKRYYSLMEVKE